ncbi:MAG: hypothetical protein ACKOSS_02585 [Planctomycetia bacterium]
MRPLRALGLCLLALLGAALAACGGEPEVEPRLLLQRLESPDKGLVEQVVRDLARQAARDPQRVVPLLVERLEQLHLASSTLTARVVPDLRGVEGDVARNEAVVAVLRQARQRLVLAGWPLERVVQLGEVVEVHVLPPADASLVERLRKALVDELSGRGTYELRAEVPPPFQPTPERPLSPWPGDAASYAAWLEAEGKALAAAQAGGPAYVPSREDVELLAPGSAGAADGLPAVPVLRAAPGRPPLGEADLRAGVRDDPVTGVPALYLSAQEGKAEAVQASLTVLAGLRVWLLEDGRPVAAVRLPARPGSTVPLPVRAPDPAAARQAAARLAGRMSVGRYVVPSRAEPVVPASALAVDEPVCRALVRSGPAAEPALEALAARRPELAELVARLREGILQVRTE